MSSKEPRRHRWLLGTTLVLGLLTGAYFFFQNQIVDSQLRPVIERELAKAVHSQVSIESVKGSLAGNVVLNHVFMIIPGSPWETHLAVDHVSVSVDLIDLVFHRKPPENCFKSISFIQPKITLVKNQTSSTPSTAVSVTSSSGPVTAVPFPLIPIPEIIIREGALALQPEKTPKNVLVGLNFQASTNNGAVWGLLLQARPSEGVGSMRFNGSLRLEDLKVSGKVFMEKWPLASANLVLKELAGWELQGGSIDVESPFLFEPGRNLWFDAKANLEDAVVKSPAPLGIVFSKITGRAYIRPNEINIPDELRFNVGETPFVSSGLIPLDGRPLSVRTKTDDFFLSGVFTELLKVHNLPVDGKGTATLVATGPLSDPVIQGSAKLGPSHVGDWPIDSLEVSADYAKGQLNLDNINGKLCDGSVTATGSLGLTGEESAPVSLKAYLTDVDAQKVAAALGISSIEGHLGYEIHYDGTVGKPILSAGGDGDFVRTLRGTEVHYSIHNSIQLKDQKLIVSSVINDKASLNSEFVEKDDHWDMVKFSLVTGRGRKASKISGKGTWPKADDKPIDIQIQGKDISLQDIPFLNDQYPDVTGRVNLEAHLGGLRKEMTASVHLSSRAVTIANWEIGPPAKMKKAPLECSIQLDQKQLTFEKMDYGNELSITGYRGLDSDAPNDLLIKSRGVPIGVIAEFAQINNPPQPFKGSLTGDIRISGTNKDPIYEGNDTIDSLEVGDWHADKVQVLMKMEDGKLKIKKVEMNQGEHSFSAVGWWDTKTQPGVMSLHLSSNGFQLGKGPFLSGEFQWDAQSMGELFWKNWTGTFSSPEFKLFGMTSDGPKLVRHFHDFSMSATSTNSVITGKVRLGKNVAGSALIDLSGPSLQAQALLKIEPVLLADVPDLTQFLPSNLKVSGTLSGQIRIKKGTFDKLPMEGAVLIKDGRIQNYDFDTMQLTFDGERSKIFPQFSLTRDEASYSLGGSIVATKSFWDPDAEININGPFKNERLANILALLGASTGKHKVSGLVNGNLKVSGILSKPSVGFGIKGENLRYDNNIVPLAELHFSESEGKISIDQDLSEDQKNQIDLVKGQIDIEKGSLDFDPDDPSVAVLDLSGSTQDVPIGGVFDMTSQIRMSGRLALEEKENRPTFEGMLSMIGSNPDPKKISSFDLSIAVHQKVVEFKPLNNENPQLIGQLDISQPQKIVFKNLHLEHASGSFSVDGTLDMNGPSQITSDAKDIPIESVGRWVFPKFPLSGTGNYHLIFNGTLDDPIFTTSFSVSEGKVGNLNFDLLDGELRASENTLFLGGKETPITLSRKGLFSFTVDGKMPLALTKTSWLKVKNEEMNINANMDKGDFSLILLAGLAKQASGSVDFSSHVGGTLDDPVLTMDLDLQKCRVVPYMVAHEIDDINGRIKVRNNRLAIEDLNGLIGQGRVFISSPPVEGSKMVLENFVPQYLDLRVRTIGEHGVFINVPDIMRPSEWGEIKFYGQTPDDPLLIYGPLTEPQVNGTALLDTGHYTFPPVIATDENGGKVEYRELANVEFDLNLVSGKNTWYSNDFNTCYLEVKIDPNSKITLTGKDADRTPEEAGIKCFGSATSSYGWLRYLSRQFQLTDAQLTIAKGKLPFMQGHATDRLLNVDVNTSGGIRKQDVNMWMDFKGTFGNIDFKLDSDLPFQPLDKDTQQKILLSYIMFGKDMTGASGQLYTTQQLQDIYNQQNIGQAASGAAIDAINRIGFQEASRAIRPWFNNLGVDVDLSGNLVPGGTQDNSGPATGTAAAAPSGGPSPDQSTTRFKARIAKPLDRRLSVYFDAGVGTDQNSGNLVPQPGAGIAYQINNKVEATMSSGVNDYGQQETKFGVTYRAPLGDIIQPKKGDKTKPHFLRFDVLSSGPGKYQLNWETDKVTKSEVRVVNADKEVVQSIPVKGDFEYDHETVIENLKPDQDYTIQVTVRDANGNEETEVQKIRPITEDSDDNQ